MTVTLGRISMTPASISSSLTLDGLFAAVLDKSSRYSGAIPSSGWGATDSVNNDYLGSHTTRPTPGTPVLVPQEEGFSRYIQARYYWDGFDQRALEYASMTSSDLPEYQLQAVDVMISETPTVGEFLLFVSSGATAPGFKTQILGGIESKLQDFDPQLSISTGSQYAGFGGDDFFLWLLHRVTNSNILSGDLSVSAIRDLSGQDALSRPSSVSKGASVDRPELLSMIARKACTFGPAKFACYYEPLHLHLDLDLRQDGAFLLQLGNSWYAQDSPAPSVLRTQIVRDATYTVIPALRTAYYSDKEWDKKDRDAFITKAINDLSTVVSKLQATLKQKLGN